jgi:hypothetical protein
MSLVSFEAFRAFCADPDFMVGGYLALWEESTNPVYLWRAIALCLKHKKPLPPDVTDYLAGVAQRMEEAKASADLRKVLPKIMGFPVVGRGPGRQLDPEADEHPDAYALVIRFGIELERVHNVSKALKNATACERFPRRFGDADDKTLKRWMARAIELDRPPRTKEEWRSAIRSYVFSIWNEYEKWGMFSRNPAVHNK